MGRTTTARILPDDDARRQLGTIDETIKVGLHPHYQFWSVDLIWKGGGMQGFGGIVLAKGDEVPGRLARRYVDGLCDAFGVPPMAPYLTGDEFVAHATVALQRIAGMSAYALRKLPGWGETIVGLECYATGRRFTHGAWARECGLESTTSYSDYLARVQADTVRDIQRAEGRLTVAVGDRDRYIDWSNVK